MTREEATEILENKENYVGIQHIPAADVYISRGLVEAINVALSALRPVSRERVEKVWRGEWEWYDEEVGSPLEGIEREWGWRCSKCKVVLPDDFDDPDNPPVMRFCQWCGSPLTDEAVDMMLERLEEVENES